MNQAEPSQSLINRANLTYKLTLLSVAGLLILFCAWFLVISPPGHPFTILSIHCVPLLLFVPGLLKRRPKAFVSICFVILLYFCQGVMNSFALPHLEGQLGLIEALLAVSLFCSAMMAGRYHARL